MVYVLNIEGNPLMPCTEAKARRLLKAKRAIIVKYEPFTIQLTFECENQVQEITLGVDAGSKIMGLSATTDKKELYASEVMLRDDIVNLLTTRKQKRRARRSRLRYRQARFNNRVSTKKKGWLAPSIEHKIQTHLTAIRKVHEILPISKIIVETASFDIQKIKNPDIEGVEYQHGEQLGFWNVREYVLFRDGHRCHGEKGCKNKILNVHHIVPRIEGGSNRPDNLITLCKTCHNAYHNGTLKLDLRRGRTFRNEAFMGIMRPTLMKRLKEIYPNVEETFGYITKNTRIRNNLSKTHCVDARCISGNPIAEPMNHFYLQRKVRCHNRQIHKDKILKGGVKKRNQAPYKVFNFRLFDKVKYNNETCFIFGRRIRGYFDIRKLNGDKVNGVVSYKKLDFLNHRSGMLIEKQFLPRLNPIGLPE